jgi:hypothetical protein
MFNKKLEDRMVEWRQLRDSLEKSDDPLQYTIDFFAKAPLVKIAADPWDRDTWLDPWELLAENSYCEFVKILAICYTLQLTDRFSQREFEINIVQDKENSETKYLLLVDGKCIGYDNSKPISISNLPKTLEIEKSYTMPSLQ